MATSAKVLVYFLLCVCVALGTEAITSTSFVREDSCRLQDRIDNGCAEQRHGVFKSLVACAAVCREGCLGFVKGSNNDCYIYKSCVPPISCNPSDVAINLYKEAPRVCQNNGVLNKDTNRCQCVDNWVGDSCERHPKACRELLEYGYSTEWPDSRRWVDLHLDNYPTPITVVCFISEEFQNTMIFSNGGLFNNFFDRKLSFYQDGFFRDFSYFWIGLENVKALNDAGLDRLYLNAGNSEPSGYKSYLRQYNGIRFGNASTGYSFTFTSTNASDVSYGDCLGPLQNVQFSTSDKDNDEDTNKNCASDNGMGWWFKDCNMACEPLGMRYIKMAGLNYVTDVTMMFVTH